jgi:hypothetical protein
MWLRFHETLLAALLEAKKLCEGMMDRMIGVLLLWDRIQLDEIRAVGIAAGSYA